MVTEQENLNFQYFSYLCIILLVLLNTMEYIPILSKQFLKRNTNNYNDVMMYLGHIWPNGRERKSHHKI